MKKSINLNRLFQYIGMILILVSFGIVMNSCEQDELVPTKPIDSSCDTINVSFDLAVRPILEKNCTSCHNNSFSAAKINLEGYDNVNKTTVNDILTKSLTGSMKSYISDECEIAKIKAWVNQGSINN
ncbi:MAG: hypothetical protein KGZ97_01435 [Bacteroidetes bacterium]|nr:hypothetical protein [Bacteroidota bacterium]